MFKFLPVQISTILAGVRSTSPGRNVRLLAVLSALLIGFVLLYTLLFHAIMAYEGRPHSWITGLYWTMATMSTLGYGDVVFQSDLGKLFTIAVVLSGMILLLVLVPVTFIEFFYKPFIKAQRTARAPRSVPPSLKDHVILTHDDPVSATFIRQLQKQKIPYVLVAPNVEQALALHDAGINVVVADLNDPASFERCGTSRAAMVAATGDDFSNTAIAFNARALAPNTQIVTTAEAPDSADVLRLAGSSHVMRLSEQLGIALARRTIATDAQTHQIGRFNQLRISEAMIAGTPLVGKTLAESRIRHLAGVTVIGLWQRGAYIEPKPDSQLTADTMLLLAGTKEQMEAYNTLFCIYHRTHAPCVIIGAGRVGQTVAHTFRELGIEYRVIDKPAADIDHATLDQAGIQQAPAVIITHGNDAANIYLAIYCRKLRADIQIIARATTEASVAPLHNAGADVVMSYATMGANTLYNLLRKNQMLLVAEGLSIFRTPAPESLAGKAIADSGIRRQTGCSIVSVHRGEDSLINPEPSLVIEKRDELILIGTVSGEEKFLSLFA